MRKIKSLIVITGIISAASVITGCNSGSSIERTPNTIQNKTDFSKMYGKEADLRRFAQDLLYTKNSNVNQYLNFLNLAKFIDNSGFSKLYDTSRMHLKLLDVQPNMLTLTFALFKPHTFEEKEAQTIKIPLTLNDYNSLIFDHKLITEQTVVDFFSDSKDKDFLIKTMIYKVQRVASLDVDKKINYYNLASSLVRYSKFMEKYEELNMNIQKVIITKSAIYLTGIPMIGGIEPYDNLVHFKLELPNGLYNTLVSDSDIFAQDSFMNINQKSSDVYDNNLEINQELLNKTIKEFSLADDVSVDVNLTYGDTYFSEDGEPIDNTPYDRLASEALKYPAFRNVVDSNKDFSIKLFAIEDRCFYIRVIDKNGVINDIKLKITSGQHDYFNKLSYKLY